MENIKTNTGGVNREYARSIPQKWTFVLLHLGIVAFCAWLTYFDGWSVITSIFDLNWTFIDQDRALILFACVVLYWVRHTLTVFYLLARKIEWAEVFGDFVLFTGWCLFTYNYWSLFLPLSMAYSFVYFHIPSLDLHLAERYGDEFKSYSIATKRFIHFVY